MNTASCDTEVSQNERTLFVKQVRRWGNLNTDAVLDSNCQSFTIPEIDGSIRYRVEENCAVVFGDPLCAIADQAKLTEAFQNYCKEKKWNLVFAIASEQFANSEIFRNKAVLLQFGNKLILEASDNPAKRTGSKAVLIRKKVKHAQTDGVVIQEYTGSNSVLEATFDTIGKNWLKRRNGPQVHIAYLDFFNDREGKRWFYATHKDQIVGFLILNEIQANQGWLLNNLIITTEAPSGTSELLITNILQTLENEKYQNVIVGPVTGTQIDHIAGLNELTSWLVKVLFKGVKRIFRLDGQRIFWEKFQPKQEPSYVIFEKLNYSSVKALMRAMNVKL